MCVGSKECGVSGFSYLPSLEGKEEELVKMGSLVENVRWLSKYCWWKLWTSFILNIDNVTHCLSKDSYVCFF